MRGTPDGSKTTTYQVPTSGTRIRYTLDGSKINIELPEKHTEDFKPATGARRVVMEFGSFECK